MLADCGVSLGTLVAESLERLTVKLISNVAVSSYETWTVGNPQKADALLVLLPSCKVFDSTRPWCDLVASNGKKQYCDNVHFNLKK